MSDPRPHSTLYRVFRRDIGRKLIALLLAVLLFSAIDRQVRETAVYSVPIRYVRSEELLTVGAIEERGWVLLIPERSRARNITYVVPETLDRPKFASMELRGTKTAVEEALRSRVVLTFDPRAAGRQSVSIKDVRGLDALQDLLGEDGVDFEQPLEFEVLEETVRRFDADHFFVRAKTVRGGWSFVAGPETVEITPNPLFVRGPKRVVDQISQNPAILFQEVVVREPDGNGRAQVELELSPEMVRSGVSLVRGEGGEDADLEAPSPRANLILSRPMKAIPAEWARFSVSVNLRTQPAFLKAEAQQRWAAGERLAFASPEAAGTVTRLVQVFAAESEVERFKKPSAILVEDVRKGVWLACLAEQEGPARIRVLYSREFPDLLEVRLVDPRDDQPTQAEQTEEVQWIAAPAPAVSEDEENE